jgi:hypothetical protein
MVEGAGARKPRPVCRGGASAADIAEQCITAHFVILSRALAPNQQMNKLKIAVTKMAFFVTIIAR